MPYTQQFYLYSGSGGYLRRAIFDQSTPPSWSELVSKTHELFGIPKEHIALSYRWEANNELSVLLTSDRELRAFYDDHSQFGSSQHTFYKALRVVDLRSSQTGQSGSMSSEVITPSNTDSVSDALVISSDPFHV